MLEALLRDLERLPDVTPVTTWDTRLPAPEVLRTEVHSVDSAADEWRAFQRLAANSDTTVVIAPETDDVLARRLHEAALHGKPVNCDASAARRLADKLKTFQLLSELNLRSVPTTLLAGFGPGSGSTPDFGFPRVVKPRYGAGCVETFVVCNEAEFTQRRNQLASRLESFVVQPHIAGESISVAAISSDAHGRRQWNILPIARQLIHCEAQLRYGGGTMPHVLADRSATQVRNFVGEFCERMPGIRGYIGFDLIVTDDGPMIVDVNPRLTTSYLGYRKLANQNLAREILGLATSGQQLTWKSATVTYGPE